MSECRVLTCEDGWCWSSGLLLGACPECAKAGRPRGAEGERIAQSNAHYLHALATDPRMREATRKLEDAMTRDSPLLAKVGKPRA